MFRSVAGWWETGTETDTVGASCCWTVGSTPAISMRVAAGPRVTAGRGRLNGDASCRESRAKPLRRMGLSHDGEEAVDWQQLEEGHCPEFADVTRCRRWRNPDRRDGEVGEIASVPVDLVHSTEPHDGAMEGGVPSV